MLRNDKKSEFLEDPLPQAAAYAAAVGQAIEILALTSDETLLVTLQEALANQHRLWRAAAPDQAVELIMAGNVGVMVIDTLAAPDCGALCDRLRRQFPDLVLIVTGTNDDQTRLIGQITAGDIYRFMHKPVSSARAHQFIETSVRRHLEGRTLVPGVGAKKGLSRTPLIAGATVLVIALITVVLLTGRSKPQQQTSADSMPTLNTSAQPTVVIPKFQPAPIRPAAEKQPTPPPAAQPEQTAPAQTAATTQPPAAQTAASQPSAPQTIPATSAQTPAQTQTPSSAQTQPQSQTETPPPVAQTPPAPTPTAQAEPAQTTAPPVETAAAPEPKKPEPAAAPPARQLSEREAFLANVVPITALTSVRQTPPQYPSGAQRRGVEGWVDVEFTVATNGTVKDVNVTNAQPANTFEEAASNAVLKWKFKPVMKDGRAVEQRAKLRLRFSLQN